jgi:hypothetical protein
MGRFVTENEESDLNAAFYHLKQAANLGILDAILSISKIYLNLPHDILPTYKVPVRITLKQKQNIFFIIKINYFTFFKGQR